MPEWHHWLCRICNLQISKEVSKPRKTITGYFLIGYPDGNSTVWKLKAFPMQSVTPKSSFQRENMTHTVFSQSPIPVPSVHFPPIPLHSPPSFPSNIPLGLFWWALNFVVVAAVVQVVILFYSYYIPAFTYLYSNTPAIAILCMSLLLSQCCARMALSDHQDESWKLTGVNQPGTFCLERQRRNKTKGQPWQPASLERNLQRRSLERAQK